MILRLQPMHKNGKIARWACLHCARPTTTNKELVHWANHLPTIYCVCVELADTYLCVRPAATSFCETGRTGQTASGHSDEEVGAASLQIVRIFHKMAWLLASASPGTAELRSSHPCQTSTCRGNGRPETIRTTDARSSWQLVDLRHAAQES